MNSRRGSTSSPIKRENRPSASVASKVICSRSADFPATELWCVFAGKAPGRIDERQVTLFDSVGFALEDYSALRFMRDSARALGLGQPISLIPSMANPKDLFSLVRPSAVASDAGTKMSRVA